MINPLDVAARAAAIPSIVLSASSVLFDVRRRYVQEGSGLFVRLSHDFIERIEEQCHTRWADLFASKDDTELDTAA